MGNTDFYSLIMSSPGYTDMHHPHRDVDKRFPSSHCSQKIPTHPAANRTFLGVLVLHSGVRELRGQGRTMSPARGQTRPWAVPQELSHSPQRNQHPRCPNPKPRRRKRILTEIIKTAANFGSYHITSSQSRPLILLITHYTLLLSFPSACKRNTPSFFSSCIYEYLELFFEEGRHWGTAACLFAMLKQINAL